jgi:hypothetical protein
MGSGMEKTDLKSGITIQDHISKNLLTILALKIFKFLGADPGIRHLFDPGSGIKIPDPATLNAE